MGLGFKPFEFLKSESKKRKEREKEMEKYLQKRYLPYTPSTYEEIQGLITTEFGNIVQRYPHDYASAVDKLARTKMMQQGLYVPSNMERSMLFTLGFVTFIGLGILAWRATK